MTIRKKGLHFEFMNQYLKYLQSFILLIKLRIKNIHLQHVNPKNCIFLSVCNQRNNFATVKINPPRYNNMTADTGITKFFIRLILELQKNKNKKITTF